VKAIDALKQPLSKTHWKRRYAWFLDCARSVAWSKLKHTRVHHPRDPSIVHVYGLIDDRVETFGGETTYRCKDVLHCGQSVDELVRLKLLGLERANVHRMFDRTFQQRYKRTPNVPE
jgi:hypothetical protein